MELDDWIKPPTVHDNDWQPGPACLSCIDVLNGQLDEVINWGGHFT